MVDSVSKRAFVCEESATVRAMIAMVLTQLGYEISSPADAGTFSEAVAASAPDLVVIPINWIKQGSERGFLKSVADALAPEKGVILGFEGFEGIGSLEQTERTMLHGVLKKGVSPDVTRQEVETAIAKAMSGPGPVAEPEIQIAPDSEVRILLVDDSSLILDMNTEILVNAGFSVITAVDGVDGAEKAFRQNPDLIISDVEMPRMTGFQMCRLLKSHPSTCHIPIVMSTTLKEARDKFWGRKIGVDRYLVKGFTKEELVATVSDLLTETAGSREQRKGSAIKGKFDVFEQVNNLLDRHLFKATVVNEIREIGSSITDYSSTFRRLMSLIRQLFDLDIAAIFVRDEKQLFISIENGVSDAYVKDVTRLMIDRLELPDVPREEWEACVSIEMFGIEHVSRAEGLPRAASSILIREAVIQEARPGSSVVFGVFSSQPEAFASKVHGETLELFSAEARIVIESACLYNSVITMNEANEKLQTLVRQYVSASTWEEALEQSTKKSSSAGLSEKEKEYTILFSDICSFTTISERLTAKEVIDMLNTHFSFLTTVVQANHGDVDKYIGDCIMAKFEKPEDAVRAAFQIQNILKSGKHVMSRFGVKNFQVRVGLNTGKVIEGSIGSHIRKDYTVIGDAVNTASRMESTCPKGSVLITESTYICASHICDIIREDCIMVKGKTEPVKVYEVAEKR